MRASEILKKTTGNTIKWDMGIVKNDSPTLVSYRTDHDFQIKNAILSM